MANANNDDGAGGTIECPRCGGCGGRDATLKEAHAGAPSWIECYRCDATGFISDPWANEPTREIPRETMAQLVSGGAR